MCVKYDWSRDAELLATDVPPLNDPMPSPFFPFVRFHILRMLREQPSASISLTLCIVAAVAACALLISQTRRAAVADGELAEARAVSAAAEPSRKRLATSLPTVPKLPGFQSSDLVTVLNETATESGLVLDEVTYSLDDNIRQPYLRYRITMTIHASYPLIRRLAEQLAAKVPHLTLDAIDCSRKDVGVAELSCDMAMSGFYSRGLHG